MSLQVLREAFAADRITRELVDQVHARGTAIAYEALEKKAQMGDRDVRVEVDGRATKQIEGWQRRIRLSWASATQLAELVDFVWQQVQRRTPVLTGRLVGAWEWRFNGRTLGPGGMSGQAIARQAGSFGAKDELRLVNLRPYIRKAEKLYVKKGIAEAAVKAAKRRFRGFIVVDAWMEIPGLIVSRGIRKTKTHPRGTGDDQRVPTVLILRSSKLLTVGN